MMKKTVLLISMYGCAVCAAAQSTCENRVDAHPKATTRERVNYCLTANPAPAQAAKNEWEKLVFSGMTARPVPADKQPAKKPSARKGTFAPQEVEIVEQFVPTQQFPQFSNTQLSEQEKELRRQQLAEERAQMQQEFDRAHLAPVSKPAATAVASATVETARGLQARHTKPLRRGMKATPDAAAQTTPQPPTQNEALEEVASPAADYAYDQNALPAEISSYTPYTPADQTPASSYEPYAPATQTPADAAYQPYAPAN